MHRATEALSQHCVLMELSRHPLQFIYLWRAVHEYSECPIASAIEELLFEWNHLRFVLKGLEEMEILGSTDKVRILEVLCFIIPQRYNLTLHKFLERFLPTIRPGLLLETAGIQQSEITDIGSYTANTIHEEINQASTLKIEFRKPFIPLQLTFQIHYWHHNLVKSILFGRRRTFLSPMQEWMQLVDVENEDIDKVRIYTYAQAKNLRTEFEIYASKKRKKCKRSHPCRGVKFQGPKIKHIRRIERLREFLEANPIHPALEYIPNGLNPRIVRLASFLSRKFFGSLYRGKACLTCLKRYLQRPLYIEDEDILRMTFMDYFDAHLRTFYSFREFTQALTLTMQYFAAFYDDVGVKTGMKRIVENYIRHDFCDYSHHFPTFLKIMESLVKGIVNSGFSLHLQRTLQSEFEYVEGLSDECWSIPDSCTDEMVDGLLKIVKKNDLIKFLELACMLDLDCICHGRILEQMLTREGLIQTTILSLKPIDPRFVNISDALLRVQSKEGGGRLKNALIRVFRYMLEKKEIFNEYVHLLRS
jgi:hypothetical protein